MSDSSIINKRSHRHRDDLHEWAIYRQNVTKSMAEAMFASADQQHPLGVYETPDTSSATDGTSPTVRPRHPFIPRRTMAKQRSSIAVADGDAYLRFGLPRVALTNKIGHHQVTTLQRPDFHLRGQKRATSEMEARPLNGHTNGKIRNGDSIDHHNGGAHYAHSDVRNSSNPYSDQQPMYSGTFLQSKRHHAHYFSNVDLFQQNTDGYNYLRYAKAEEMQPVISKAPHFVMRNIAFDKDTRSTFDKHMLRSPKYTRLLDGVTMEAFGGETIALLYTSEEEVSTLLGLITNLNPSSGSAEGSFSLNGIPMGSRSLGERVAYVSNGELYGHLTVKQHLDLACAFLKPATNAFRAKHMVSQLIQTLALSPFNDRLVSELGRTEKQRVKIACQILLDSDVIVLDNVIKFMDLYDAAFVIDYLRDWATKLNRIVIMACNPPTYELLAMFYKTAILASGRLIYFGRTQQMLNYFESLDYPCPLFKNPCDYYVDLVTHDHLTLEAAVESTERIRRLADVWTQRAPAVNEHAVMGTAPPKIKNATTVENIAHNYGRFWSLFSNQWRRYMCELWINALLGVALGVIFFYTSLVKQAGINDRFGLFHALLTLTLLPNMCINVMRAHHDRSIMKPDLDRRLYSKTTFLTAKLLFDIPIAIIAYLIYVVPIYFLANLQHVENDNGVTFLLYCAITVLYCIAWRLCAIACGYLCNTKHASMFVFGILMTISSIPDAVTLHASEHWTGAFYLRLASSTQWTLNLLSTQEFVGNGTRNAERVLTSDARETQLIFKETKRIVRYLDAAQTSPIYTSTTIQTTGAQAYTFANMSIANLDLQNNSNLYLYAFCITAAWALAGLLFSCVFIYCNHQPVKKRKHRD